MMETAVVIGVDGQPIYWHLPNNRSTCAIPDSRELWDVIWEHRNEIEGIAHTHPGSGRPAPSHEDVTTFSAIESALGRTLLWWIVTETDFVEFSLFGPDKYDYGSDELFNGVTQRYEPASFIRSMIEAGNFDPNWELPAWVEELRRHSYQQEKEKVLQKPAPHLSYNWESVEKWLLSSEKVTVDEMSEFLDFVYGKEEFGMDRGFTIESEHLTEDYQTNEEQRKVISIILEEFGTPGQGRWENEKFVNFSGRF